VVVGAVVALSAAVAPAAAHNELIAVTPADAGTVAHTPPAVVLTFDQPVLGMGTVLSVTDGAGAQVQEGRPRVVDNAVTQALRAGAPAGAYRVEWRVTSADGHAISGATTFTSRAVGGGQPTSPEPATASPPAAADASVTGRTAYGWLVLLGLTAAVAAGFVVLRRHTDRRMAAGR
jgi:copper resistance protein C